jgi:hypothetical protein
MMGLEPGGYTSMDLVRTGVPLLFLSHVGSICLH